MASVDVSMDYGVIAEVEHAAAKGVETAMTYLLQEANKTVPLEDGTLKNSGQVELDTDGDTTTGYVSYNTPYARYQHETMGLTHKGQGRAKWLELTAIEKADKIAQILANSVGQALGA